MHLRRPLLARLAAQEQHGLPEHEHQRGGLQGVFGHPEAFGHLE
jgi:hypothetical protein